MLPLALTLRLPHLFEIGDARTRFVSDRNTAFLRGLCRSTLFDPVSIVVVLLRAVVLCLIHQEIVPSAVLVHGGGHCETVISKLLQECLLVITLVFLDLILCSLLDIGVLLAPTTANTPALAEAPDRWRTSFDHSHLVSLCGARRNGSYRLLSLVVGFNGAWGSLIRVPVEFVALNSEIDCVAKATVILIKVVPGLGSLIRDFVRRNLTRKDGRLEVIEFGGGLCRIVCSNVLSLSWRVLIRLKGCLAFVILILDPL